MIQTPQIPTPPGSGFDPNLIFANGDGPQIFVMIVFIALVASTIILWPIMRALGRRMEHKGDPDPALRAEIEQPNHRLAEVETVQGRLAELEERLDFAERLLAQHPETRARLGAPTEGERSMTGAGNRCSRDRSRRGRHHFRGPIGSALARRIGGRPDRPMPMPRSRCRRATREVDAKDRLAEVEERLDFAERLLAKASAADQLHGGIQR